jgi:hypothetical protein
MTRMVFLGLAVSAALLASLSCGGGGGTRDTSLDVSMNAPPVGGFDGYIVNTFPLPTPAPGLLPGILVGDLIDVESRGFVTFDISLLPPSPAVVRAATLEVEQWQVTGNPYPSLGSVAVDHVNLGPTFDTLDYDAAALDPGFATLTSNGALTTYAIDVRSQVGADQVAGRTRSSFRLRFNFPGGHPVNGNTDSGDFNDAENRGGSGLVPKLTIVYTP